MTSWLSHSTVSPTMVDKHSIAVSNVSSDNSPSKISEQRAELDRICSKGMSMIHDLMHARTKVFVLVGLVALELARVVRMYRMDSMFAPRSWCALVSNSMSVNGVFLTSSSSSGRIFRNSSRVSVDGPDNVEMISSTAFVHSKY
ncbi:hypothetical protein OGAPHI_004058 [Ogataea philodendri]|uniref:Uncharacterized protein n=1 Tax=Ogataea philodendri TaxID=1378263 RepID=A0A9P8T529_9ASCO|nr:uncharacterized protein OGAPHI_004058 [Ogataea philodendri]KAH3665869.1 hypothetical protein OGAPHI_004058 [Ogataea philodendri]